MLFRSPAQAIEDAKEYTFGILETVGREFTDQSIIELEKTFEKTLNVKEYDEILGIVDALYSGEVPIIIFNEAYRDIVIDTHTDFEEVTRVLEQHQVETEVVVEKEEKKDIVETPFHVYISGIDTFGNISKTSRSDVNVIATVNPKTQQILLTSTPRDSYVPLSISNGIKDKLTDRKSVV